MAAVAYCGMAITVLGKLDVPQGKGRETIGVLDWEALDLGHPLADRGFASFPWAQRAR